MESGRTDSETCKNNLGFHFKLCLMTQKQWRWSANRPDGITTSLQPTTGVDFRGTLYKLWQEERYRAIYKAIVLQHIPQVGLFLPFCPVYIYFFPLPGTVAKREDSSFSISTQSAMVNELLYKHFCHQTLINSNEVVWDAGWKVYHHKEQH